MLASEVTSPDKCENKACKQSACPPGVPPAACRQVLPF